MNKTELYSDLSYNPSTDFETLLMESLIDDAEAESFAAHAALESYLESKETDSFTDALESLMIVLEGDKEDCEKKCKEKEEDEEDEDEKKESEDDEDEDAEEATLRAACEAADASLGQKIAAAWKHFKERALAFFNRIAQSLQNAATRFNAMVSKRAVKTDVMISGKIVKHMDNVDTYISLLTGVTPENVDEAAQKVDEAKKQMEKSAFATKDDDMIRIGAGEIKKWLTKISNLLKACSKALSVLDKRIVQLTKEGSETARSNFQSSRSIITDAMTATREAVSGITTAIHKANDEKHDADVKAKKNAAAAKKAAKGTKKTSNDEKIEHVDAEVVK